MAKQISRPTVQPRVLIASESAVLLAGMHAALRSEDVEVAAALRTLSHLPASDAAAHAQAVLIAPANGHPARAARGPLRPAAAGRDPAR